MWWMITLAVMIVAVASGALDGIGWAFYRAVMDGMDRKRRNREYWLARQMEADARLAASRVIHATAAHQYAHTMASLTGQAYLVRGEQIRSLSGSGTLTAAPVVIPSCGYPAHAGLRPEQHEQLHRHELWAANRVAL